MEVSDKDRERGRDRETWRVLKEDGCWRVSNLSNASNRAFGLLKRALNRGEGEGWRERRKERPRPPENFNGVWRLVMKTMREGKREGGF